jgi:hypothetical protein
MTTAMAGDTSTEIVADGMIFLAVGKAGSKTNTREVRAATTARPHNCEDAPCENTTLHPYQATSLPSTFGVNQSVSLSSRRALRLEGFSSVMPEFLIEGRRGIGVKLGEDIADG